MSSNNAPPSDQAGTSPSPRRKKMLSFDTIAANQDFFFVDESLPPAAAAVTAMVAGDGGQRSRQSSHEAGHPAMTAAPFSQQSMMGPILRRKRVVSMPLGGNSANELLFFGDRRGVPVASHPIHTVIDEAASAITEEGSASNLMATPASRAPPAGHHRVRQSTAPAGGGGGLFDAQVGTAGGGPARRARPHRGKSNSFMAGVLARRAVAMDMLPSEEADLGVYEFFQPIADAIKRAPVLPAGLDRGEECKEEMEEEDQDLEEGDVVGEQAPAVEEFVEGAAGEGEAAAARGEAKKKLFKPLVFAPHVVPRGGSAGHGHHGGGHGAHLPAPSAKTEVLTAPEAVPLAGGEGMIPEEGADTSGESEEDIEGADLLEKYDDSHIIRATRKDYFYTGILFCVMAALVGVVVGWDTHLDESDSIFGPVGLACKTPCRGDIYDQDYFRGRNTFETGNVIFLNPHIDATLTKNSYLRMVIRGVESNMTKWVSLDDVFGPASVEGERVTKEERVTVDWEYPGEQHVIDVISTTGSQELPPPYTEALEAEEELHSEEEHADEESHANNATGGVATTKEGESDAGDSEGEAASQFHRLLSSSSGGDNSATLGIPHHGELTYSLYASTLHPISRSSVLVAAIIMIIVYIFILLEVIHRTLVAIFGSFVALFFFFLMHDGHTQSISTLMLHMEWSTLGLLFGMMLLVGELSHTGVFEWCAVRLLFASKGSFNRLMMLLCSLVALSSAFLDNVTTMLLIAPVTIDMCGILGVDPRPYLIGEVLLSNVGGTATLIGDPPNIIIGSSFDEIGFVDFIINILPCIFFFCVPISLFVVLKIYKHYLTSEKMVTLNVRELKKTYQVYDEPRLLIAGTSTFFVILMFFLHPVHHKDTAWIALLGAFITIAFTNPHDVQDALRNHVEWDTLLFFAGLFVLVEVCAAMGLLQAIGDALALFIKSQDDENQLAIAITLIIWVSAMTSAFLDNIPYTATMIPVVKILADELPDTLDITILAWALSFGACLGGNGTLLGASANIVTAGLIASKGYGLTFLNFFYPGMLTMIVTVAVANIYMLVVYVWI